MAVYPAQLTTEEKNLKKRYVRLQEKRKLLRKPGDKSLKDHGMAGPSRSPIKQTPKEVLNPKDAKDAAKKLLMAGKLSIPKQPTRKTGFKRVGELPGREMLPPAKKANTGPGKAGTSTVGGGGKQNPPKPKIVASDVKELYSRFVKASKPDDLERIPKRAEAPESSHRDKESESKTFTTKDCTVYVYVDIKVKSLGLTEEALRVAFSRFGTIQSLLMHKGSAFLTFDAPSIAATVKKEMSGGMIRGTEVRVDFASEENGYVELTPEAASNPWSVLAAERDTKKSEPKAKSKRPLQVYGTAPF